MFKILLVGSGWASTSFIKNIDTNKYDLSVVSPTKNFIYTPLLANSIINNNNLEKDITKINNINFIKDLVVDIDFSKNTIYTKNKEKIDYDFLVLAHGSQINTFNIKGVEENCLFIKTPKDTEVIKNKLSNLPPKSKIAVIGCNLTGSEIVGNLLDYDKFNIYAIDGVERPLSIFNKNISDYTENLWREYGVNMLMNNFVKKIDNDFIYFNNDKINYDLAIWCGGIKKSSLTNLINTKLNLDCRFGIPVNHYLKVNTTPNVFAMGDCAYSGNPPTAQVAYQQGKYLANRFNNNFNAEKKFDFESKGQIGYIGKGKSVYQTKHFYFKGKLTGYLNDFIHFYNQII